MIEIIKEKIDYFKHLPQTTIVRMLVQICVVLASLVYISVIFADYLTTEKEIFAKTRSYSRLLKEHSERTLESADLFGKSIVERINTHNVDQLSSNKMWSQLRMEMSRFPQVTNVVISDKNGNVILHSGQYPAPTINFTDRRYYYEHNDLGQDRYLGEIILGRPLNNFVFSISHRIADKKDNFDGIVLVGLSKDYFVNFYEKLNLPTGSVIGLFKTDGKLLVRIPFPETIDYIPSDDIKIRLSSYDGSTIYSISPIDGVRRVITSFALEGYPAFVVVGIPHKAIFDEWVLRVLMYTLILGGWLLLLWLFAAISNRTNNREKAKLFLLKQG